MRERVHLQKQDARARRLGALSVLHPANMTIRRDQNTNRLIYEWWNGASPNGSRTQTLLHIRGDTMGGGDVGYSPIQVHRHADDDVAAGDFENKHFQNDARPGVALIFPMGVNKTQADEWGNAWDARRRPQPRPHRRVRWWRDIKTFPISLEDQQWVESQEFNVREVARMYGIPAALLEEGDHATSEEESLRWLKFGLGPRLVRIQRRSSSTATCSSPRQAHPRVFH